MDEEFGKIKWEVENPSFETFKLTSIDDLYDISEKTFHVKGLAKRFLSWLS